MLAIALPNPHTDVPHASAVELATENEHLRRKLEALERENQRLVLENSGLQAQNRLAQQNAEALGSVNRYHANRHYMEKYGRLPEDWELFVYYVDNGGKTHFDEAHPPRG